MATIKDVFLDVSKNVINPGYFETIKITSTRKNTLIEAISGTTTIVKGVTHSPVSELGECEFGLSNLGLLSSIVNDSLFKDNESKVELIFEKRESKEIPSEFLYTNKSNSFINYRFVSSNFVGKQPVYSEPKWDIRTKLTKSVVQQFFWLSSSLNGYEKTFTPKLVNGDLKFFIGKENSASQRGGIVISNDITGKFDHEMYWPISTISPVLKLVDGSESELCLNDKAMQINIDTGVTLFRYIFPKMVIKL